MSSGDEGGAPTMCAGPSVVVDGEGADGAADTVVPPRDLVPTAGQPCDVLGSVPTRGAARGRPAPATALGWVRRSAGPLTLMVAVAAAFAARAQAPWIPLAYLVAVVVAGVSTWTLVRWRSAPRLQRLPPVCVAVAVLTALCPVPWLEANLAEPPGTAWRLDGRLSIEGQVADPKGSWYWLTVGRPPLVMELVGSWLFGDSPAATSLRNGRASRTPRFNEPAAAAVGLRRAGREIAAKVVIEVGQPTRAGLPDHAAITGLNGVGVSSRDTWVAALATLTAHNVFTTDDGATHRFTGAALPYRRVEVLEVPAEHLDVAVGGWLARTPPGRWFRNLAVGRSHGLMVALVSYVHASGHDLAAGRVIAGTGSITGDGTVGAVGGLRAKAAAARRTGADMLLFPLEQAPELDGFDAATMRLVPVATLDEAIEALTRPRHRRQP